MKTVKNVPSCRDQIFFFSVKIFKIEIFQSRYLSRSSRYIETNQDCWDFSRFIKISWYFWEIFTNRQLWKVTSFHRCLLVKWIKSSNEIYENYSYFSIEIKKLSRYLDLDGGVETKSRFPQSWSRYLDCRD